MGVLGVVRIEFREPAVKIDLCGVGIVEKEQEEVCRWELDSGHYHGDPGVQQPRVRLRMWRCGNAALRFVRRRLVLAIIFASSLSYCIVSLLRDNNSSVDSEEQDVILERKHPFIWRTLQEHNETEENVSCRNSIQGKVLVVDDRGFVCHRPDILPSGCCNSHSHSTKQYSCATCSEKRCCVIYEYCVACCLHPDKREILEAILDKVSIQHNVLLASVSDHFELCLAKCRTNSLSVHHENSYKDPKRKHCYGEDVPGS